MSTQERLLFPTLTLFSCMLFLPWHTASGQVSSGDGGSPTAPSSGTTGTGEASPSNPPPVRAMRGGLSIDEIEGMANKHDSYLSALAPENLKRARPKPPFDLTGVWFIDLRRAFSDYLFGPPYPEFMGPARTALQESREALAKGIDFRNSTGVCIPAGMPMISTYVWPTAMIQLPTVIWVTYGQDSTFRAIFIDGRSHTDPDIAVTSYNGEAVGRWEGNELVVRSKYFEPRDHYIDFGIPISDQFELVERMRLKENGKVLEVEYTLIDPLMWKGEWKNTKRFLRQDYSDLPQVTCTRNTNATLPSTQEGAAAIEQREATR